MPATSRYVPSGPYHRPTHSSVLGAAVSALAGLVVIHVFLGVIRRIGVQPFVIYRVLLGVFVGFWYFAQGG